ncbi:MAG: Holliday junction resolvase RuvX [Zoogloeaceae bacterium]|nr:Holliday junction resolvase RuvX [Zoogloeaceae bacterium]MCK6384552.1 Holliday junction resolvase RuvX [Rhodocyclaceae bacterium]
MPALMVPPRPTPPLPAVSGTVLAFDFGLKRIGIAVGETLLGQARALTTIEFESSEARFAAISRLIEEWRPALLVVGLPLSLDGEEHDMTLRCRRFANKLRGRFSLPVTLCDERLTSAAAETELREAGIDWRARRKRIDALAAQHILQDYFDAA